jgi:hypothetical protein
MRSVRSSTRRALGRTKIRVLESCGRICRPQLGELKRREMRTLIIPGGFDRNGETFWKSAMA